MLLQFDLKHIHKVNFYPSDNNFTQALLVMLVTLVTNMISGWKKKMCEVKKAAAVQSGPVSSPPPSWLVITAQISRLFCPKSFFSAQFFFSFA